VMLLELELVHDVSPPLRRRRCEVRRANASARDPRG
jgi:hypothetical protein